ncbi:MAG TPA: flagellar basal body rod protein FlgC [Phycisphaerae bacterium]|nr:flagellar basal body rod protein FlgC [Phycisphaerae bacterium]
MGVSRIGSPVDIAISGLRAEAMRMKVIAENIANAHTTRTESGEPYRRKSVVLEAGRGVEGVAIKEIVADTTTGFKDVFMPGHPDADDQGVVRMPNVDLPVEMINMVVASRAYQANAAILKRYQDMVNATLELLR